MPSLPHQVVRLSPARAISQNLLELPSANSKRRLSPYGSPHSSSSSSSASSPSSSSKRAFLLRALTAGALAGYTTAFAALVALLLALLWTFLRLLLRIPCQLFQAPVCQTLMCLGVGTIVFVLVCRLAPIRPHQVVTWVPSISTSQNLLEVPSSNSNLRRPVASAPAVEIFNMKGRCMRCINNISHSSITIAYQRLRRSIGLSNLSAENFFNGITKAIANRSAPQTMAIN